MQLLLNYKKGYQNYNWISNFKSCFIVQSKGESLHKHIPFFSSISALPIDCLFSKGYCITLILTLQHCRVYKSFKSLNCLAHQTSCHCTRLSTWLTQLRRHCRFPRYAQYNCVILVQGQLLILSLMALILVDVQMKPCNAHK